MQTPIVLLLVLVSISVSGVHSTAPAKPHKEIIEVIEVQEVVKPEKHEHIKPEKHDHHHVKPVKHEHHHVKPVEAVPVKHVVDVQALKQTVQRLWPLFCLIPKAYHIHKPLKVKCPKLLALTTAQIVEKVQTQIATAHPRPVVVEAKPVVVEKIKVKV